MLVFTSRQPKSPLLFTLPFTVVPPRDLHLLSRSSLIPTLSPLVPHTLKPPPLNSPMASAGIHQGSGCSHYDPTLGVIFIGILPPPGLSCTFFISIQSPSDSQLQDQSRAGFRNLFLHLHTVHSTPCFLIMLETRAPYTFVCSPWDPFSS